MILFQQTINNISQSIIYDSQQAALNSQLTPFKHYMEEYMHTLQCSNNRKYLDPKYNVFHNNIIYYRECLQDVTFYDKHKLCLAKMVPSSINNYILLYCKINSLI